MIPFGGMRIIESQLLTEAGEPYDARRSWRERLFSWPWQPWKAIKRVTPQVPMKGGYQLANGTVVMHPVALRQLKQELDKSR